MVNTYGETIYLKDMEAVKKYSWNGHKNNWAGHHFETEDGYVFKTEAINGSLGWPDHEKVKVFKEDKEVLVFEYEIGGQYPWNDFLRPIILDLMKNTDCNWDLAMATAEYIYAKNQIK